MDSLVPETVTERAKRLEAFETPEWAAHAILKREILTPFVVDPCVGKGALADAARRAGHHVLPIDIYDWSYPGTHVSDFLTMTELPHGGALPFTVFCNPPFSLATDFVRKSFDLGARKIVMFQRFAFWESLKRRAFWEQYPPTKIYICGERADCWRFDIPDDERGSSTPTAHAWFCFDAGHKGGTILDHIWKGPNP